MLCDRVDWERASKKFYDNKYKQTNFVSEKGTGKKYAKITGKVCTSMVDLSLFYIFSSLATPSSMGLHLFYY